MEDAEQIDLIDFSAENDNLILNLSSPPSDGKFQSSDDQKEPRSSKVLRDMAAGEGDASQGKDEAKQVPELAESEEPQRTRRNGKCNLRKSLAWDSAFFTSAGVLDPEELSSIMRGAGKGEKNLLPGIQEDIRISSDSISTLESDSLTLENLEVELFEDIRASIQKSCKAVKSCSHTASEAVGNKAVSSLKVDLASANHLKPKPVARKMTGLQTMGVPKCQPKMSAGMQGSGIPMKPESSGSQVPKPAIRTRESTSSVSKPPKENGKVNSIAPATAKRASMGASRVKADNDNAKTGRGIQTIKAPVSSSARRVLPKPSSSKSSSLGPSTVPKTQSTRSTPGDNSGCTSSDSGGKSPVATVRRKVATRVLNPPSFTSVAKTPSRSASKSKSTSKNSSLSAYLMSSKMSSNISPASSISEWSSASSSSSSVNQRSNKSRTSVGSSSCKSLDVDTSSLDQKTDTENQRADGQEKRGMVLPDKNMRRSVVRTGTASHSASMRPSGLRMPSPKIGFFDGVKSVRTPNGTLLSSSGLPAVVSKTGAASREVGKLPPGKISTALANLKPETEKPNSSSSSQEKSQASTNIDEKVAESYSKSQEVAGDGCDEAKCDAYAGFGATMNQNLGVPKSDMSLDSNVDHWVKDVELVGIEGDYGSKSNSSPNISALERLDSNLVHGQHHLTSNLNSLYKTDEKENVHSGDQVDGLRKHGVDRKADAQIVESLGTSECTSATICETTSHVSGSRTPLAVKNSLSHGASVHFSHVSADQVLEKSVANLPHLEGDDKETIIQSSS